MMNDDTGVVTPRMGVLEADVACFHVFVSTAGWGTGNASDAIYVEDSDEDDEEADEDDEDDHVVYLSRLSR
jgi:hypothetical protein